MRLLLRDEPEVLDVTGHVARRPREQRALRRRQGPARDRSRGCPSPSRASARTRVISVDDHVVEPPDAFTGRFPKKFADEEPRVVPTDDGGEAWVWQGQVLPNVGFNAVVGRPSTRVRLRADPLRRDAPRRVGRERARRRHGHRRRVRRRCASRRSCPASSASASRCGPTTTSSRSSRCARTTTGTSTRGAARIPGASSRTRSRTCAIPQIAADEIRRNAARGFKAVTFSEAPDKLGLPTIHSGYWDPLFAACEETETVLCLHVGSSGTSPTTSADAPPEIPAVLFGAYGMYSAVDWLYSKIPVRFPDIKICLSEGGIGWVAGHHRPPRPLLPVPARLPADVARRRASRRARCCAATSGSARSTTTRAWRCAHRIGVDHILVESDYPHADSSWPDTQAMLVRQLRDQDVPDDEAERITWRNASELFRHQLP